MSLDLWEVLRVVASCVGLFYQARVAVRRYRDWESLRLQSDAHPVEFELLRWHRERAYMLLGAHGLLFGLTALALWGRYIAGTPVPPSMEWVRNASDIAYTVLVVLLARVSYRAVRHQRIVGRLLSLDARA